MTDLHTLFIHKMRGIYRYLWITQRIGLFLNRFPLSLCRSQDRVLMQWKITSVTKWQNRTGNLSWKWRNSSRFYENLRGKKKRQKQKKRIKQFLFKFENKVLQKTGTLWSNHQLLIKQKQGNEKSVQVHTGLININIILHIYMCYLSCFTMVNILLIVYLQFEIWHHFIFGSRLYCVFFQHGVQIYQSSILHSGTDTWLNNLIESKLLLDRCEEVYLYVIKLRSANFCFSYNLCTNSGENWHCLEMCV